MSDQIGRLSYELARDPSSLVFLQLGDTLRREGQLDLALKVTLRGLERHPHNADAHDLLARVYADRGELQHAVDEWDTVRRLAPGHAGARKGIAYVLFKVGRLDEAQRCLHDAVALDPADRTLGAALEAIGAQLAHHRSGELQPAAPLGAVSSVRALFADILGEQEQTALLVDGAGHVIAGAYVTAAGEDVSDAVGAELAGVGHEVRRAARDLELGDWRAVAFEAEAATVAMAPVAGDSLVLVAAGRSIPLGFVRRVLDRCADLGRTWLGVNA